MGLDRSLPTEVTHAHPEAMAGAVALPVAAALAFRIGEGELMSAEQFLQQVVENVPESETASGIQQAVEISIAVFPQKVARQLGAEYKISAQDTVPFVFWGVAHHLDDYQEAFWVTVSGLGESSNLCDRNPG